MPIDIVDVDAFTDPIVVPADSDPASGAGVRLFAQQLANRTRHNKNRLDGHDTSIGALQATDVVAFSPAIATRRTLGLATGMPLQLAGGAPWEFVADGGEYLWRSLARGEIIFPINPQIAPVSTDGGTTRGTMTIESVAVFLKPGAVRSDGPPVDRMQVFLFSQTVTAGALVLTSHASEMDDGSTNWQTVTATPGATVTMSHLAEHFVLVVGGNTADVDLDRIGRVIVEVNISRPPL